MDVYRDKRIVLGVTGSIATYKAVALASTLVQAGAVVDVIMTEAATEMVRPLSFQAITHRQVQTDMFSLLAETEIGHVTLGREADVIVIAPATANTIAKLALGLADNVLGTTVLAARCPIVVAPAMESTMWTNPITQQHVTTLRERGMTFVMPESGHLASGASGVGRLARQKQLLATVTRILTTQDLVGRTVVVTAGGTREPIDPVRYISNASSGRMGYAVAQAAATRGATVTLITATRHLPLPAGVTEVAVTTAREMRDAVLDAITHADALLMAAAVADYRPEETASQKRKKGDDEWTLRLVRNPDILMDVKQAKHEDLVIVGWAAETENLVPNAEEKLKRKALDLIIANPVPQTFGSDRVQATLISREGVVEELDPLSKMALANRILDIVAAHLRQ